MRRVLASVAALALGAAVLLPTASAAPSEPPAESGQPSASVVPAQSVQPSQSARPSASVEPRESASVEPSPSTVPSEPVSRDAQVAIWNTIYNVVDDDWEPAPGWEFGIVVTNGIAHDLMTDDAGGQSFAVTVFSDSARVEITETPHAGFKVWAASCTVQNQDPFEAGALGTLDGTTLTFDVEPGGVYACDFVNGPPVLPDAQVFVWNYLDADGDLDTWDDVTLGVGSDFSIRVTDGTASRHLVTTDSKGVATFKVTAYAKLEITQVNASNLLSAWCWDIWGEDPIHGGYTQDGATLAFGTEPRGVYGCTFFNLGIGVKGETGVPVATAPPTDTLKVTSGPSSDAWRMLLIGLSGLIASILVLTPARHRRR